MVMSWLKLIPLELQEVETLIEPLKPVGTDEKVVGTAPDAIRKMYTYMKVMQKEADLMAVELKYSNDTELIAAYEKRLWEAQTMKAILWGEVQAEFGLWGHSKLCAIRTDWQVVEYELPFRLFPPFFKFEWGFNERL
jgi:hypothetical protein